MNYLKKDQRGFTLIELLIVIVILAILAAIVFVALDPATRFADARDSRRAADISQIAQALVVDQIDNGGTFHGNISTGLTSEDVYMIVNGTAMTTGCADNNGSCDTNVDGAGNCVDLSFLVDQGYLGQLPVSPAGAVTWDDGDTSGEEGSGYTLEYNSTTGSITVRSCESENSEEILIAR